MAVEIVRRIQEETGAADVPTNLVIGTVTSTTVAMSWDASPSIDFAYYTVYRSADGTHWGFVATTALSNYTDTVPDVGTWYYSVSSTDQQGNESDRSDSVTADVSQYTWYDASQRLGTPNALPAALLPLAAGDQFRQNGPVTPTGYGTILFGNFGYMSATFIPQQTPVITYSTVSIGVQATPGSGDVSVPLPATYAVGDKFILFAAAQGAGAVMSTNPAGYTLVSIANNGSVSVWEKVVTASESAPTIGFTTTSVRSAFILCRRSSSGWPAGSSLIGTPTTGSSTSITGLRYQAYTVPTPNLDSYQVGWKNVAAGNTSPISAIGVTSGYVTGGSLLVNQAQGFALGVQIYNGDAYSTNLATNDVATTGNTDTGGSRRLSFSLKGAVTYSNQQFTVPMRFQRAATGVATTYNLVLNP